ncbi:tRNA pseudouridine(38-40) synthase TruA [candidate division TA06 bacterium]|uniref:tRNA pseudouridine synthase A n=1 Tax=candidate division TA06 bacterium TaxID=2250710 RepID=A0A933IF76_UNCT6|nr:tRNA pseudouridine(38-40) synthase TruA [candidate division TA06 bacterium]
MKNKLRNIKLLLEYDGTAFAGWQVQPEQRTVQGVLEPALSRMTGEKVSLLGSGRTDAGVHASGQVANFRTETDIPLKAFCLGLNAIIPDDVAVLKTEEADPGFNSRFDARSRSYRYQIITRRSPLNERFAWAITYPIDQNILPGLCQIILGRHDFTSFASAQAEVNNFLVEVTMAEWTLSEGSLVFQIEANRFLHNMVRIIVGSMIDAARGHLKPEDLKKILEAKDRTLAGKTAPACGLCLVKVEY